MGHAANEAAYLETERHALVLVDDARTIGDDRIAVIALLVAAMLLHLRRSSTLPTDALLADCEALALAIRAGEVA